MRDKGSGDRYRLGAALVIGVFIGRRHTRHYIYADEISQTETQQIVLPRVNINTADVKELAALDGINEELAQRIVDSREYWGKYDSLDRLLLVDGFSRKLLESLRDRLTVE